MIVNSIGAKVTFGSKSNIVTQIKKIVGETMGKDTGVSVGRHSLSIWRLGKDGKIIVNGSLNANPLTLAQDFAKVQRARETGLLKTEHVTRIGL